MSWMGSSSSDAAASGETRRPPRYPRDAIADFARALLERASMPSDKALAVAEILVEGELSGRSTHGLALLAPYLREIETGGMRVDGDPETVADFGACLGWDGRKLPGPWLVLRAMDQAMARASRFGMGAVTIRRSHHTASLGAYLSRATDRGYLMLLTLTDPGFSSVAPHGGIAPVLTSNPIAFGAPTKGAPILVDISTSMVTNGLVAKHRREGRPFEQPWLLDNQGRPSTDPEAIFTEPPGSVLPLGGLDAGHKGYGIGMMVELLTGCLSGHGRAEPGDGWSAAVFLLVVDPAAFGSDEAYLRQVTALATACRASPPRPGFDRVRLPGEASAERRAAQLRDGMAIDPAILVALRPWAEKFAVPWPGAR
ncbi:MAG TPA: Ldh family oxidoreductase [Aliidongia sp.]|nr:Ldh family oxidoreductase [Aliidongia sp.]